MHGLYLNEEKNYLRMDIIIDFDAKDRLNLYKKIKNEISALYPEYKTEINLDLDINTTR